MGYRMAIHYAMIAKGGIKNWVKLLSPTLFVIILAVAPFLILGLSAKSINLASMLFGKTAASILTRDALWNSLIQGTLSAASSFAIGVPLGIFLGRYNFRLKRLVTSLVIIPFFLPSILVVFSFVSGFGSNSILYGISPLSAIFSGGLSGIVAINTFFNAPLVALFTMTGIEQRDQSQDEAAKTLGAGAWKRFINIWGRHGIQAGIGASVLAFIYSFSGFAAPLIIGGPKYFTLDALIYFAVKILDNIPLAVGLSVVEALILILPAVVYVFLFRSRKIRSGGTNVPYTSQKIGGKYFTAGIVFVLFWIIFEMYLLASVLASSLTLPSKGISGIATYFYLFGNQISPVVGQSTFGSIVNSLFYGSLTALLTVVLGMMWIVGKRRLSIESGRVTEISQYIPLVLSAIIMSFAILVVLGDATPISLLWVLIVGAQTVVAIPVVLRVIGTGFSNIPSDFSEASMVMAGSPFFDVELPLAKSTFASALMFGFAISIGEFSATNFLATGTFVPLSVEIYVLFNDRLAGVAYAAASVLLLISLVSFYVIQRLGERFVVFR